MPRCSLNSSPSMVAKFTRRRLQGIRGEVYIESTPTITNRLDTERPKDSPHLVYASTSNSFQVGMHPRFTKPRSLAYPLSLRDMGLRELHIMPPLICSTLPCASATVTRTGRAAMRLESGHEAHQETDLGETVAGGAKQRLSLDR